MPVRKKSGNLSYAPRSFNADFYFRISKILNKVSWTQWFIRSWGRVTTRQNCDEEMEGISTMVIYKTTDWLFFFIQMTMLVRISTKCRGESPWIVTSVWSSSNPIKACSLTFLIIIILNDMKSQITFELWAIEDHFCSSAWMTLESNNPQSLMWH